jgi:Phosphodiester glycosidase
VVGAVLAGLVLPSSATGYVQKRTLFPGVTYTREVTWRAGGPLVLHVLRGPRPGGLYHLKPVLSGETVSGVETVTQMQRRYSARATVAGVNGDYFSLPSGHPNSLLVRKNVLLSRPLAQRSSMGIGLDGLLRVSRVRFSGTWTVEGLAAHPLSELNRPLRRPGAALFTSSWGARTPASRRVVEVVLPRITVVRPNAQAGGIVLRRRLGGGHPIPPGGAVLQLRGSWWIASMREAKPGRKVAFEVRLDPWWSDVRDAIGGGPVLVQDGVPVANASEAFTSYQLDPRHPRTAVGQLANGRVIMVVVDGRSPASWGLTNWQMALELARLGAVRAMGFDGGGSSTIAFDRQVLNAPSDGRERLVGDALLLFYFGVYTPQPRYRSFSPNGDGVADVQRLRTKIVRRSDVLLRLVRPDGAVRWRSRGTRLPGTFANTFSSTRAIEGTWRWVVSATDARGRTSQMARSFVVNKTLGFLQLSKERMRVRSFSGGRLVVSVRLTNPARFGVTVRRRGRIVRTLYFNPQLRPGAYAVVWNGKNAANRIVRSGIYTVRVRAHNALGTTMLERTVRVRRVALPSPSPG